MGQNVNNQRSNNFIHKARQLQLNSVFSWAFTTSLFGDNEAIFRISNIIMSSVCFCHVLSISKHDRSPRQQKGQAPALALRPRRSTTTTSAQANKTFIIKHNL